MKEPLRLCMRFLVAIAAFSMVFWVLPAVLAGMPAQVVWGYAAQAAQGTLICGLAACVLVLTVFRPGVSPRAQWIRIVAFAALALLCGAYVIRLGPDPVEKRLPSPPRWAQIPAYVMPGLLIFWASRRGHRRRHGPS